MKIIFDYNRTLFDPNTETLFPEVLSVLEEISKKHELFLVSQKEAGREDRFLSLGIDQYFKNVFFVEQKTTKLFLEIKGQDEVFVIGDSLANEIRLGKEIGAKTIHVNRKAVVEKGTPDFTVETLEEIIDILQAYEN